MRTFLAVIGGLVLVAIAAIIGFGIYIAAQLIPLQKEAAAYVDEAVPAIAATWEPEELVKRASPNLRELLTPETLKAFYEVVSQAGPLVKYEGAECDSVFFSMSIGRGTTASAKCLAHASATYFPVAFRIGLVKLDDAWWIEEFYVDLAQDSQNAWKLSLATRDHASASHHLTVSQRDGVSLVWSLGASPNLVPVSAAIGTDVGR